MRFTDWHDAHREAQRRANTTRLPVAIRACVEFGKLGYNVSYASVNDSDFARAEIVLPDCSGGEERSE